MQAPPHRRDRRDRRFTTIWPQSSGAATAWALHANVWLANLWLSARVSARAPVRLLARLQFS